MKQLEAKEIIEQEKLKRYNWFNEHPQRENEVGITVDGDQWAVYVTNSILLNYSNSVRGSFFYYINTNVSTNSIMKQ